MPDDPVKLAPTVRLAGLECDVYRTTYPAGGATALFLDDTSTGAPVATATVNVPEANHILGGLGEDRLLIKDYAENEGMFAALQEAGIVEDTGEQIPVGFTHATIARLLI